MNVNLTLVDLDDPSPDWQSNIRQAIEATSRRLYVYFEGTPTADLERVLYGRLGCIRPEGCRETSTRRS